MEMFYGTKKLLARLMTLAEYNTYRGWTLPSNEDGSTKGYLVEYLDGGPANDPRHKNYISWSPAAVFEAAYQPVNALSFGHAVAALKEGRKVARSGWNGKNMFLYYVEENKYPAERNSGSAIFGHFPNDEVPYRAYIAMLTAQNDVVPWVASQSDVLANDWYIVE